MQMLELFGENMDAGLLNNIVVCAVAETYRIGAKRGTKRPRKQCYFQTSSLFFLKLIVSFIFI
jgi:hypothetical protein